MSSSPLPDIEPEAATKLKPCPFCGGQAEITEHYQRDAFRLVHRCRIVGPIVLDWTAKEILERTWNTRHSP